MSAVLSVLRLAREMIASPERWTKGALARDRDGYPISIHDSLSDGACQWCAIGAIQQACVDMQMEIDVEIKARGELQTSIPDGMVHIDVFNDAPNTTHADILALLDETIERLEGEQ